MEAWPRRGCLIDRGAGLSLRAKLPGHYERHGEVVECTPLGYALRFQETRSDKGMTVALLRERRLRSECRVGRGACPTARR